jgi:hypothetical protein
MMGRGSRSFIANDNAGAWLRLHTRRETAERLGGIAWWNQLLSSNQVPAKVNQENSCTSFRKSTSTGAGGIIWQQLGAERRKRSASAVFDRARKETMSDIWRLSAPLPDQVTALQ